MIDINLLRNDPDLVRENIKKKFQDKNSARRRNIGARRKTARSAERGRFQKSDAQRSFLEDRLADEREKDGRGAKSQGGSRGKQRPHR